MKFTRLLSLCNFLTLSMNHALFVMCIPSERVTKVLHKLKLRSLGGSLHSGNEEGNIWGLEQVYRLPVQPEMNDGVLM